MTLNALRNNKLGPMAYLFTLFFAVGCAGIGGGAGGGTGVSSPFISAAGTNGNVSSVYALGDITVAVQQNPKVAGHPAVAALPNEREVEQQFARYVQSELSARGLYSRSANASLTVDLTYTRLFVGEIFGTATGWGPSNVSYIAKVVRDGYSIASSRRANTASSGSLDKALAGVDPAAEQAYLQAIAKALVDDLAAVSGDSQ